MTTLSPQQVISTAKTFFARRNSIYSAFLEKEGPGHVTFRGQGGEEIAVGAVAAGDETKVTASTYLFDQQVARFLASLPARDGLVGAAVEDAATADTLA